VSPSSRRRASTFSVGPPPRCSAVRVVVQSYTSSLGGTHHRWAFRVVVGPYGLLLGRTRCCSALRIVVGLYASPLGHTHRRWAVRVIVGLYASSLGPSRRCWALRMLFGASYRRWAPILVVLALCHVAEPSALSYADVGFPMWSCGSQYRGGPCLIDAVFAALAMDVLLGGRVVSGE